MKMAIRPSLKKSAITLALRSRGTVHRYIRALEEENFIRVSTGRSRGIELVNNEPAREKVTSDIENDLPVAGTYRSRLTD